MTLRFPARNHQSTMAEDGRPPAPAARAPSVFRRFLVRVTPAERLLAPPATGKGDVISRDGKDEKLAAEVGSVALDRMDASDDDEDDFDFLPSSSTAPKPAAAAGDAAELIKGLVQCASAAERALLADATRIADRCGGKQAGGGRKRTKAEVRRAVADGLRSLGYDAAVCRSRWDNNNNHNSNKGPAAAQHPAGEHEYIDALLPLPAEAEAGSSGPATRVVVEVDFRAEFEVARPTKPYRAALQALPPLFVGTPDRVGRVVAVVAEAARQSLRKRGLHFPPWRKAEYMRAKWLAPHYRCSGGDDDEAVTKAPVDAACLSREIELRFDDEVITKAPEAAAADDEVGKKEEDASSKQQSSPPQPHDKRKLVVAGL
ncbi:hypothetical protein PR202_gb12487 [Eleusine coracana subsp. coracana]|uniref:Uncharacterized protein n=1 Tax=Eleusine coracana subsp. coracana TaxID=191504 RepID=A0AAV5EN60_ELECO|nr:hypothetical protein PR202_gb12487 [Eleusine coracana subsp. coracana]